MLVAFYVFVLIGILEFIGICYMISRLIGYLFKLETIRMNQKENKVWLETEDRIKSLLNEQTAGYSLSAYSEQQEVTLKKLYEIEKSFALRFGNNSAKSIQIIEADEREKILLLSLGRKKMLKNDNIEKRVLELVKWQTFILEKASELNAKGVV